MALALRSARMAGSWYPGDASSLSALLRQLVQQALASQLPKAPAPGTPLICLQAPHAGYLYSGFTAALAYASLGEWRPRRVVVLAPSHRELVQGAVAWSPVTGQLVPGQWETPLGRLDVDHHLLQRLGEVCSCLNFGPQGHGQEHALELQLPFMQFLGWQASLAPICVGSQDLNTVEELARALAMVLDEVEGPTLLVASSDLSHFHSQEVARSLDAHYLNLLVQADARNLLRALHEGECEACGGAPAAVLLECLRLRGRQPQLDVLDWRSSAAVSHDEHSVVGYAAVRMLEMNDA